MIAIDAVLGFTLNTGTETKIALNFTSVIPISRQQHKHYHPHSKPLKKSFGKLDRKFGVNAP